MVEQVDLTTIPRPNSKNLNLSLRGYSLILNGEVGLEVRKKEGNASLLVLAARDLIVIPEGSGRNRDFSGSPTGTIGLVGVRLREDPARRAVYIGEK